MAQEVLLTKEGYQKLTEELNTLKTVGRDEIAEKIKVALSFGDLSENSEYDEAKNEQGKMEHRINEIEETLKYAKIIDDSAISTDTVSVGLTVTIKDLEYDEVLTYKILGDEKESDPDAGIISAHSPIGAGLIGHHKGEKVDIEVPAGIISFEILDIEKK